METNERNYRIMSEQEKKRVGLFCYFSEKGTIDRNTKTLIQDLKKNIRYLAVIVNGGLCEKDFFSEQADILIERENTGYDAGAYKIALEREEVKNALRQADSLIFCNSSFYGPFVSFESIFDVMDKKNADFWGIANKESEKGAGIVSQIQSYFLCFNKRILDNDEISYFFINYVFPQELTYQDVCMVFENGLFLYLTQKGYSYDAWSRCVQSDIYSNPYGTLAIDNIIVLKKKIFSDNFYVDYRAKKSLEYIKEKYRYDISGIIKDVNERYGRNLSEDSIDQYDRIVPLMDNNMIERNVMQKYIMESGSVYIYGFGNVAKSIYSMMFCYPRNPYLKGFVVSDDQDLSVEEYKGYRIFHLSEIIDECPHLLIALTRRTACQVISKISKDINFLSIWE